MRIVASRERALSRVAIPTGSHDGRFADPGASLDIVALTIFTFLLAGLVKGVIGLGLPSIAIGLLALLMPPAQAAAIMIFPSLVTNVWQMFVGPYLVALIRRLWTLVAASAVGIWLGGGILTSANSRYAAFGLGVALIVYAAIGLSAVKFAVPRHHEWWLNPDHRLRHRTGRRRHRRVRHSGRSLLSGDRAHQGRAGADAGPVVHRLDHRAGAGAVARRRDALRQRRRLDARRAAGARRHGDRPAHPRPRQRSDVPALVLYRAAAARHAAGDPQSD